MTIIFVVLGLYPFTVYPILMWAISRIKNMDEIVDSEWRSVSIVIAAFNEEGEIRETVVNKLNQDYPSSHLNVIVVSDGSTDKTDEVVSQLASSNGRVTLIRQEREGKTAGLNRAVAQSKAEIIIFSDANSQYAPSAVKHLVSRFADDKVGYVTGRMEYKIASDSIAGQGTGTFMSYESRLRAIETRVGSIVGVNGGIDAVRRKLYKPMRPDQLPDFVLPLSVVESGFRVVYESKAILEEDALKDLGKEFRMRVRVATRAIWALAEYKHLLNPFKYGVFSFQLLSHKWLRYLAFFPFLAAIVLSFSTATDSIVSITILGTAVLSIVLSVAGFFSPNSIGKSRIVKLVTYFVLLNLASFFAIANVLRGERYATWTPRTG